VLARKSLVALEGGRSIEDESTSTRLLVDIRTVFAKRDRISSRELLGGLHELEEAPWGDWFGKPLSAAQLNRLLHDFSIHSRDIRFGEKALKGFHRNQFQDAWARYVQPEPRQRDNPHPEAENRASQAATDEPVSRHGNGRNPTPQAECRGVAAESAELPEAEVEDAHPRARHPAGGVALMAHGLTGETQPSHQNGWTAEAADQFIKKALEIFPGSAEEQS